jgi:succinate dehydrogenase/fumarate reductase-like Fe-S protein
MDDIIKMIPVYVMGRRYEVPRGLTILKALEFAGYRITRGCGCRGGVCGACVTVFRRKDDFHLQVGLACQTVVEPDIYLTQLPYVPAHKAVYSINRVLPDGFNILSFYPELTRCMGCNTCTKSCPMGLEVMNYIAAALRNDLALAVELSMECVMCGMCAARCPAELAPFNIALLIRRIYGRHVLHRPGTLDKRLKEIEEGRFSKELLELRTSGKAELEERFKSLQATRGSAV